jgi:hypothetical protein
VFVQSDGDAEPIVRDRTLLGFVMVFRAGADTTLSSASAWSLSC